MILSTTVDAQSRTFYLFVLCLIDVFLPRLSIMGTIGLPIFKGASDRVAFTPFPKRIDKL
jgi:hypothetical protein